LTAGILAGIAEVEQGKEGRRTAARGQLGRGYVFYFILLFVLLSSAPLTDPMMSGYGYAWTAVTLLNNNNAGR
jgi:hypothetical protein